MGFHVIISGGDIELSATDDGINAAGGVDSSGTGGRGGDTFGSRGQMGGMMSSSSNGSIVISGGSVSITAYGDGIDANGSLRRFRRIYHRLRSDAGRHVHARLRYHRRHYGRHLHRHRCVRYGAELQREGAGRRRGERREPVRGNVHNADGQRRQCPAYLRAGALLRRYHPQQC